MMGDRDQNKLGQETMKITLKVEDYSSEGYGVFRYDGKVVFVPYAIPGETVEAEIIKEHRSYSEGNLIKVMEKSDKRVFPPCEIYTVCGGCSLQHMEYEEQLRFKKQKVENALRRIAKTECKVNDVIGMKTPYQYRNKAQYSVKYNKVGFKKSKSHEIVQADNCLILPNDV